MNRSRRYRALSRTANLILLAVAAGCGAVTESAHGRHEVSVTFSRAGSSTVALFPAPYVSVLDTVVLMAIPPLESQQPVIRRKTLARRDSVASFTLPLSSGDWVLDARVVSNNGVLLDTGTTRVNVADADVSVDLVVSALAPILLASPDSTSAIVDNGQIRFTNVVLYNRGTGDLVWSISDTIPAASRDQCGTVGCVRLSAKRGAVGPGQSSTLSFIKNQIAPFQSPITFVVTSPTGSVPVVVRPF